MKQVLHIACSFLMLWSTISHTEIRIEITQGVNSIRQIGVVPFQWSDQNVAPLGDVVSIPEDISNIIAADLRNSGKFNPLDRSLLPQKPRNAREVQSSIWSSLGIDTVIVGQVISNLDGSYNIAYQLINTGDKSGTILTQNSYKVNKQWLRYAGHAASDEIFEKLTGIKGAFSTRIAYVVHTNNVQFPYELRVSDYDSYNQFIVHRSTQPLMSPAWSSDGSKLAYVTFESGRSALVIQTLTSGVIHQMISFPCHNGAPAFSPDGKKLAFALSKTGNLNLYVMDLESEQIHQITDNHSNNTEPAWFPDSQNLVFTSDQSGLPQIYKININNGATQRITWGNSQNQEADVSNDGKFIVMVSSANGQQHIAKQNLSTVDIQLLSSTFLDETPSLSPNGTMVIYGSSHESGSALNLVSADGYFKTRFPIIDGRVKFPTWSPYL